jgi:hypothetical protein
LPVEVKVGEKTFSMTQVFLLRKKHADKNNNRLLFPDREVHSWMTSLPEGQEEVVLDLYKEHATSEQYHSELKSDLDLERLPSGKFATNHLIFGLAAVVYNILKFLGSLAEDDTVQMKRHPAKRRRVRTIIQEVIQVPIMLCHHARQIAIKFSSHCKKMAFILNIERGLAGLGSS